MPRKSTQTGLSGTFYPGPHAGSAEDGTPGFRMPQQNAIVCSNPGSSGECRFKAAQTMIENRYPGVPTMGIFIARRVPRTIDVEEIES